LRAFGYGRTCPRLPGQRDRITIRSSIEQSGKQLAVVQCCRALGQSQLLTAGVNDDQGAVQGCAGQSDEGLEIAASKYEIE